MAEPRTHRLHFRALFDADAGGEEGFLRARVSELDEVDRMGFIIARGGLVDLRRDAVISGWDHSSTGHAGPSLPPVGRGYVYEEGNFLMAEGRYNLEMTAGRDAYEAVKMMKDSVEFSILMHVLAEGSMERDGQHYPTVTRYDVSEITACRTGVSYNTGVEELRADNIAAITPRHSESERRFREWRYRRLRSRRTL